MHPLNIFYDEPDPDRWLPLDRFPRRVIRRLVRGKRQASGHQRVFLNLCAGLDRMGVSYRVNDYRFLRQHPREIACVIGKDYLLDEREWKNPIILGPAIFSHPVERPDFFVRFPAVKRIVVPCEWVRDMWQPAFGDKVTAWPVGIDTSRWQPTPGPRPVDLLLYDKIRIDRDNYVKRLLEPIVEELTRRGLTFTTLRYGSYREKDFHAALGRVRGMVFLCEHETQGIAYQQALACGVPILAWDRGGCWQDPDYFPHRVKYGPVSSVPYWDHRCGIKFGGADDFAAQLDGFLTGLEHGRFDPRPYILENLTLEGCAARYLAIVQQVQAELVP